MPEQQIVEIAKALGADARVLIMDEPTASLTEREAAHLFGVIARLRERPAPASSTSRTGSTRSSPSPIGSSVLRDGENVATAAHAPISTVPASIRLMVGRELSSVFPKREVPLGDVALELRGDRPPGVGRARRLAHGDSGGDPRARRPRRCGPHRAGGNPLRASAGRRGEIRVKGVSTRIDSPQAAIARGHRLCP